MKYRRRTRFGLGASRLPVFHLHLKVEATDAIHSHQGRRESNRPDRVDQLHDRETGRSDRARSLPSSSVPVAATRSPT